MHLSKLENFLEDSTSFKCKFCSKVIPLGNKDLHQLRCPAIPSNTGKNVKPAAVKKKTPKKVKLKPVMKNVNKDDDFDALVEAAIAADNHCAMNHCKKLVGTLGLLCQHCRRRFCFSHQMPELHGCGHEARVAARQEFRSPPKGSGGSKKALKQELLRKKLNSKLQDMSLSRQGKNNKQN